MKIFFSLLLSFVTLSTVLAQNTLTGAVKSNQEELIGVTVWLTNNTGTKLGTVTDIDSKFEFSNIPDGEYTIKASFVGYKELIKNITVQGNTNLNIELEENNTELEEVIITTVVKKETESAIINTIKKSFIISDGLSVEFIKKTPDRNVGDALKRVSGVTIQNDKFVLVRGLADRYNLALVNGNRLPSTEPDRRAFSFDIIPTSLVDNILITKGATANLPGDFAGGIVQVTTKEVGSNFLNISLGSSYGTLTTGNNIILPNIAKLPNSFPSTYDYRVATLSNRKLFTNLISTPSPKSYKTLPNTNGGITYGYTKNGWNVLYSTTARNDYSIYTTERTDYQSSTDLAYIYTDQNYLNTQSLNGLLNVVHLGDNRLSWKTIGNFQNEIISLRRIGQNFDNMQDVDINSSSATQKLVINTQVDYKIDDWKLNLGYNLMLRNQPDYKVNPLASYLNSNQPLSVVWRDTYRFWSNMNEHQFNGGANRILGDFEIGGGYIKTLREFSARIFRYESSDLLNEITNNTDKYSADFDLANGYIMYQKEINKFKLNTGLRTEYNNFYVKTSDFSGLPVSVSREYLNLLPSLNLTYSTSDKVKWRLSSSRTLARPEFREVANFAYYDFVRNAQILGNTNLERSDIYNLDLKWELYPKNGENIFISLFGKQFIKPIEQIVADGSVPSNLLLTYMNPNQALVYGLEVELRKSVTNWLDVYTNSSLINSEVDVRGVKRQLQGQSNYVVNGGINLHKENNTFTISYNRVGDRISAVGFQGYPDIFENSRDVIDLVLSHKTSNGSIKLAVNDLLQQPSVFYQKPNRPLIKTQNQSSISLTLNYNF